MDTTEHFEPGKNYTTIYDMQTNDASDAFGQCAAGSSTGRQTAF